MEIIKDERIWEIRLPIRKNDECPFQFYPINMVACKALHKRPSDDYPLCKYEDCPFKIPDSLKEKETNQGKGD